MKKDWLIIRAILLRLEASTTPNTVINAKDLAPFDEQEVAYNIRLLRDAGYVKANIQESHSGNGTISAALVRSLTNSGHELLDTIRNDTVWEKIQDKFRTNGIEMSFDLVVLAGKKIMESLLG